MAVKQTRMTSDEVQAVLDRGYELATSAPYKVSLRWVFYKLLQEGWYKGKGGYRKWKELSANARKAYRDNWCPDTLADDTRTRVHRTGGKQDTDECLCDLHRDILDSVTDCFILDHFYQQDRYVEIWFEAKGMVGQFRYYTKDIDLIPFGGDPSIPFKWDIATNLESRFNKYGKDIVVLYFGDYDTHGLEIVDFAVDDISSWSNADFEVVRCGVTPEQAKQYNVPENPDRPGQYQWAALSDGAAKEIIQTSIAEYLDVDLINNINDEAAEVAAEWEEKIRELLKDIDL